MKILEITKGKKFKDNYWIENLNKKNMERVNYSND